MLIQLVTEHPEAVGRILRSTPGWVWGLLAALLALGASQLRARTASMARISLMPLGMTVFGLWGTVSAFGSSPLFGQAAATWMLAFALLAGAIAPGRGAASYDPATRSYRLPGSGVPLLLIGGVFLVKYWVGVELAIAPQLLRDGSYTLTVAALYGGFTGIFVGRAARLWRLALRPRAIPAIA